MLTCVKESKCYGITSTVSPKLGAYIMDNERKLKIISIDKTPKEVFIDLNEESLLSIKEEVKDPVILAEIETLMNSSVCPCCNRTLAQGITKDYRSNNGVVSQVVCCSDCSTLSDEMYRRIQSIPVDCLQDKYRLFYSNFNNINKNNI